jgi:WD40 repeat protein
MLGDNIHTITIWDLGTGQHLQTLINYGLKNIAVSPRGLVIASDDHIAHQVRIWKPESLVPNGKDISEILFPDIPGQILDEYPLNSFLITHIAFLDDQQIIYGKYDSTINIWNVETCQLLKKLAGHTDTITSIAITPCCLKIISGSRDSSIKIWDSATGQLLATLYGHTNSVNSVVVSPDNLEIISASNDHTIRIWDLATGKLLSTFDRNMSIMRVECIAVKNEITDKLIEFVKTKK